jgi:hypothetical protein
MRDQIELYPIIQRAYYTFYLIKKIIIKIKNSQYEKKTCHSATNKQKKKRKKRRKHVLLG